MDADERERIEREIEIHTTGITYRGFFAQFSRWSGKPYMWQVGKLETGGFGSRHFISEVELPQSETKRIPDILDGLVQGDERKKGE